MESKTPNFDRELNKILNKLAPGKRTCRQCQSDFEILKEDIAMYKKLRVPPPTLCFDCRRQRRYGFYNNILKFFKKECAAHPGEKVISTLTPESPYRIYDLKHWWSADKWDGEEYAREYDFNRPFFEQFEEFNRKVPHPAILSYYHNLVNSPYTISTYDLKDSYFTSMGGWGQNLNYCYWIIVSNDCFDMLDCAGCEQCYELISCTTCFKCYFLQECDNCIDCAFLYDCRDCRSCFGSFNLRHKSYCFFNQQLSKKDYELKIKEINLGDRDVLEEYRRKFARLIKKAIRKNLDLDSRNINSVGDKLFQAKDCYQVFLSFSGGKRNENIRYSTDVGEVSDAMDLYIAGPRVSLGYELVEVAGSSQIKFSHFIDNCMDMEYCVNCHSSNHCFACSGLRKKSYYIFNKKYAEKAFFSLVDKIKTKILEAGEYGEFFSLTQALAPYNNTYAMIEFPCNREQVLRNGWQWHDETESAVDLQGARVMEGADVSKDIKDIKDDILDQVIICRESRKPFRLIKSELKFCRRHKLAVPVVHPYQRIISRFAKRNPCRLWNGRCDKCGQTMTTSYPPEEQKKLKIYCRSCYLKEVG